MNEVSPFLARLRRGPARREPLAPLPMAADASGRWRESRPAASWPFGASVFVSLALHAGLVAALLLWPDPRPLPNAALPPPSFDMVFEGGQPERPEEEAAEGVEAPPVPPAPPMPQPVPPAAAPAPPPPPAPVEAPAAEAPPPVPAPPPPALAEAPVPRPPAAPPLPQPPDRVAPVPPPVAAPPPLAEALPGPPPPPPAPVPPRLEPPPPVLAQPPPAVEFIPPTALRLPDRFDLPLPPVQAPPPPRQQAQPRPALPGITVPDGFQLGGRSAPPPGRPRGRGLDTSLDPRFTEGRPTTDPMARVSGAQVGADWRAAFRRWLEENIHYPMDAAQRGEDGTVRVVITANPDGTVRGVRMAMPSTSPSLNSATSRPFNGARLPAFPPNSDPTVTIELTVNYVLIRGR